jgi:hypothetical protein
MGYGINHTSFLEFTRKTARMLELVQEFMERFGSVQKLMKKARGRSQDCTIHFYAIKYYHRIHLKEVAKNKS